jgi:MFS family permease
MVAEDSSALPRSLIVMMAVACGLSVANLYYSQPLLAEIERDLHVSVRAVSLIPMFTQLGYATGMLLFVPLGDMLERRKVIGLLLVAVAGALVIAALATNLVWLLAASLLIGITTIVPQLIVPFAATLAKPSERGRVVGTVMSGLLVGVLLARTVSGFVGAHFGWRAMYFIAAALMLFLACVLALVLPNSEPNFDGSYKQLMRSLVELARRSLFCAKLPSSAQCCSRPSACSGQRLFSARTTTVSLRQQGGGIVRANRRCRSARRVFVWQARGSHYSATNRVPRHSCDDAFVHCFLAVRLPPVRADTRRGVVGCGRSERTGLESNAHL